MKIFQNISIAAILLTVSLGIHAAAPAPTTPQREEWQQEAEAFLQGLHERMGKTSPVRDLGPHPAEYIARMLKTGGHFTNNTSQTISLVSLEVHETQPEPAKSSRSYAIFNDIRNGLKPGQSFRYDFVKLINEFQRGMTPPTWVTMTIEFKEDDLSLFISYVADHVSIDSSSNFTIEKTKDGFRLIVKEANESKPPATYELCREQLLQ